MSSIKHRFNPSPPTWLHIDLNSCFATIEQQANPHLRGKPIAVAAYTTPRGCILAPSIEAKRFGVKTGMRVMEGKVLCPHIIILPSDPPKYRFVNRALLKLLNEYSPSVSVRSIDEMLLDFSPFLSSSYPVILSEAKNLAKRKNIAAAFGLDPSALPQDDKAISLPEIGKEIKQRIKTEIGEWLTVSIGISTNPYLAKLAAGLHKPDGLDEINQSNILKILSTMTLVDLPYIKERNELRLNRVGIKTPVDFYFASTQQLKAAFESINGHYWYLRLHGYAVDEVEWNRKSIGHSYALPKPAANRQQLEQLLCKLVEKMGRRLRDNRLTAQGIHLMCNFADGGFWHTGHKFSQPMYASDDLFSAAKQILALAPHKPVRILAVSCFELWADLYSQLTLFTDGQRKRALVQALDSVNDKWGEFTVIPGTMFTVQQQRKILDRIAFGRVLDMPDVVLKTKSQWKHQAYVD